MDVAIAKKKKMCCNFFTSRRRTLHKTVFINMSEDFDRENDLKFVAQPYLFEPEDTDDKKLREMDVLRQNMHAL